jgi:hypothetical protein
MFLLVVDFLNVYDKDDQMIEVDLYLIDNHNHIVYYVLMLIHLFYIQLMINQVQVVDQV